MNRTHELKTWPKFFQAIWDGRKTFEVRVDDRGFREGDVLDLREWDPEWNPGKGPDDPEKYTGREIKAEVTYLYPLPMPEDARVTRHVVLAIKEIERRSG